MTAVSRRAKELYPFKRTNHTENCGKCGKPFSDGELVVPKGKYTSGIPRTVCRSCYVDAHGRPIL